MLIPQEEILKIMDEVVELFLIPRFKELNMNASGEWLENIKTRSDDKAGYIDGREYTEQLVYGRKPGKMPPIAPIERWVNFKLGIQGVQARGMAFAIATKIKNEGTTWFQKGGSNLLEVLDEPATIDYISKRAKDYLEISVSLKIKRNIEEIWR